MTKRKSSEVHITCKECGKPIVAVNDLFGMDCEDDCARKAYERTVGDGPDPLASLCNAIGAQFEEQDVNGSSGPLNLDIPEVEKLKNLFQGKD